MRIPRVGVALAALTLSLTSRAGDPRPRLPVAALAALTSGAGFPAAAGRVAVLARVDDEADAYTAGLLPVAPGLGARWVERADLGVFVDAHRGRAPWVGPPVRPLLDRAGVWTRAATARKAGYTGKGAVVGIVDTGVDPGHLDFRDPVTQKTRIAWVIDLSSDPSGKHPELEEKFGCSVAGQGRCAIYSGDDLDAAAAAGQALVDDTLGHGTHVTSLAAGGGGGGPYVGVAPEATLVVARVTRAGGDGGITDSDILNTVRFVFDRADALGMPAAVNVSLGGDFGPHDGSSPLEAGLASFVGDSHPGRAIIVAAGNSGALFSQGSAQWGVHTEVRTLEGERSRVILGMPGASSGDVVHGSAFLWVHLRDGDDVRVGLEKNDQEEVAPQATGEQRAVTSGGTTLAVVNGVVGGDSPLNAGTRGAIAYVSEAWRGSDTFALTLEGRGTAEIWVQGTGDAELGSPLLGALLMRPTKHGTVNVPASHPELLAVGCTINRLDWRAGKYEIEVASVGSVEHPPLDGACYFSSTGPNADGAPKPEISAPGAFVVGAMSQHADPAKSSASMFVAPPGRCPEGVPSCYVADARHAVASGTSMSAPQVTGAAAVLLARDPRLTQREVTTLLQGGARPFEGLVPFAYQLGPGALDLDGALAALEQKMLGASRPPSGARSWLHVGAAYARPDRTFPLTALLELRDEAGRPADADPSELRVTITNGVVTTPLHRLGPGLAELRFAGADGAGGELLTLFVSRGDEVLGAASIPIGADPWIATEASAAKGGCAAAGGARPASTWWLVALVACAVTERRRRRSGRRVSASS